MVRIREWAASQEGLDVELIPRKWERVGDVLILRVPSELAPWRGPLARAYAVVLRAKTVVEDRTRTHGPWRVPDVTWLWGNGTETVHRENRILFKLDIAKVMFSSGNLDERARMARVVRPGETVVDLFAGIGYFSLPIAVHGRPSRVIACETNPTAHHYLLENVRLNRAGAVEARLGDCRAVAPKGIADRVILGHFDGEKFLDVAFEACRERATLHAHALSRFPATGSPSENARAAPLPETQARLHEEAERHHYRLANVRTRFVKWYGPHRAHVVLDAIVERK